MARPASATAFDRTGLAVALSPEADGEIREGMVPVMLVSSVEAPEEAFTAAQRYAALGLKAAGYDGDHSLSKIALRSYFTQGDDVDDLAPDMWIPGAFVFGVLKNDSTVALVFVRGSPGNFQAQRMEFVAKKRGLLNAIGISNGIADEPGEREIRLVDIPQFNALLFWVTGPKPRFIDRVSGDEFTEEGIVDELARRRRIALGIEG